jgi:RNA recognition motif-containing protein
MIGRSERRTGYLRMKTLYVGNLPYTASESDIEKLFARHGEVHSVKLINDRDTGRPRGFGFVEMDAAGAEVAIEALNGTDFGGRSLRVNLAQGRQAKPERRAG